MGRIATWLTAFAAHRRRRVWSALPAPDDVTSPEWIGGIVEQYRENDHGELVRFALPAGERLGFWSTTVAEAYAPSTLPSLIAGLRSLGWLVDDRGARSERETLDWIHAARSRPGTHTSLNLGHFKGRPVADPESGAVPYSLPPGIEAIDASLIQFIPSVTVLVIHFLRNQDFARSIEAPFQRQYATVGRRSEARRWVRVLRPSEQRAEDLQNIRQEARNACYDFIRTNLPGVFASVEGTDFPSCDFITTEVGKPFTGRASPAGADDSQPYLQLLGLTADWDAWRCDDLSGVFLRLPGRREESSVLTLAGRIPDILKEHELDGWGGRTGQGIARRLRFFGHTLSIWALDRLVVLYEAKLLALRDRSAASPLRPLRAAVEQARIHEQELRLLGRDLVPVIAETPEFASNARVFHREVYRCTPVRPENPEAGESLFEYVREALVTRTVRLQTLYADIGRELQTSGALLSALSNEEVARTNRAVGMALAILGLLLAAAQLL